MPNLLAIYNRKAFRLEPEGLSVVPVRKEVVICESTTFHRKLFVKTLANGTADRYTGTPIRKGGCL